MSIFTPPPDSGSLDGLPGACLLSALALGRRSGLLRLSAPAGALELQLRAGRALGLGPDQAAAQRAGRQAVRAVAGALAGDYRFSSDQTAPSAPAVVELDPLADLALVVLKELPEQAAAACWTNVRAEIRARPGAAERVVAFLQRLGASLPPVPATPLSPTAWLDQPGWQPRTLLALALLGGLERPDLTAAPGATDTTGVLPTSQAADRAPPAVVTAPAASPEDERRRQEVLAEAQRLEHATHFEVLGLDERATSEQVRTAFFERAQRWHTDRFAGCDLGLARPALEQIFTRINEANQVLTDPKRREGYLYLLERQRQGLPTDVEVILEAEEVFRRAQIMFDQGKIASALPLLEKATQLNPGEAEFWLYLGYASYSARGDAVYAEALAQLDKGIDLQAAVKPKGLLFKAQIERLRDNLGAAEKHLDEVLRAQPSNKGAQRELRLVRLRREKLAAAKEKEKGGLLGKLLGK